MQDAVPIRLGQEFKAYSVAIMRDIHRMDKAWMKCGLLIWEVLLLEQELMQMKVI